MQDEECRIFRTHIIRAKAGIDRVASPPRNMKILRMPPCKQGEVDSCFRGIDASSMYYLRCKKEKTLLNKDAHSASVWYAYCSIIRRIR